MRIEYTPKKFKPQTLAIIRVYLALEREVRHDFRKGLSMATIVAEAGIPPEPVRIGS